MPDLAGRALPILGLNPKGVGLRGGETAPLGEVRARAKALSEPLQRSGDCAPSVEGVRGAGEAPDNPSSLRLGRAAKGGNMALPEGVPVYCPVCKTPYCPVCREIVKVVKEVSPDPDQLYYFYLRVREILEEHYGEIL